MVSENGREWGWGGGALFFLAPWEFCVKRNRKRENVRAGPGRDARVVPEDVLRRMARRIEPPTREEGFSRIVLVRSGAKKSRRRAKLGLGIMCGFLDCRRGGALPNSVLP